GKFNVISLPKVEQAYEIKAIDWIITKLENKKGLPKNSIRLNPTIETATGFTNINEISSSSSRIRQLDYGMADLASDMNIVWPDSGQEMLYFRTKVVIASRTFGLEPPLDTVWPRINDIEGLIKDSQDAKVLGFQGKAVIHPKQIDPVNQIFTP